MIIEKIIIIGAGGTGSWLCSPLARYLQSIDYKNSLVIIDGDSYDTSNVSRQSFSVSHGVGLNKAEYQAMKISYDFEPDYSVEYVSEFVGKEDIDKLVTEGTVVFNCVDSLAARKYVEDRVATLNNAMHICCGNELRTGQVQVYYRKDGKDITPSIYKRSPEFDSVSDDRSTMSCSELSELEGGGQIIAANLMAASLALNYFVQVFHGFIWNVNKDWVSSGSVFFDLGTGQYQNRDENAIRLC
jgi:molybdopterin/thiamine biosynthesis adenylyltransferase